MVRPPTGDDVTAHDLARTVAACRDLIATRFPGDDDAGAAAMLLDDGTVLTGTAPEVLNASVELCHEVEPFAAAHRLGRRVRATVCLHRERGGRHLVLAPCGVCRERLAVFGPRLLAAVPDVFAPDVVRWRRLGHLLPDYWLRVFPDDAAPAGWD